MGATAGVGAWGGGWSARLVAAGEWGWALGGLCAGDRRGWVLLAGCALAALALSSGGGGLARVPPAGGDGVGCRGALGAGRTPGERAAGSRGGGGRLAWGVVVFL